LYSPQYFSRETKIIERAKALKVNAGTEPDADLGPVISKQVSLLSLACYSIINAMTIH